LFALTHGVFSVPLLVGQLFNQVIGLARQPSPRLSRQGILISVMGLVPLVVMMVLRFGMVLLPDVDF
jgi:hypothetical protein